MSNNPEAAGRNIGEQMAALAAAFVEAGKGAGLALDYLPRTLPIAEKFVKGAPAETERLAAYFGEVVRRDTQGFWFEQEYVPMVYAGIEPYVDPGAVVKSLLETGRATAGDTAVESLKAYCEAVSRLQRQWLDGSVLGHYPNMSTLRTAMAADARTAGLVLALAQQAVLTAQLDWSEPIDCSEDSLDAIERILAAMHHLRTKPDSQITDEQVDALSRVMGVAVGEVIRRHYGGQWRASEDGSFEIPYPGTTIHPIARARKRIVDGPAENVKMYFSSMQKVIAS
jgi:hypothetical protein